MANETLDGGPSDARPWEGPVDLGMIRDHLADLTARMVELESRLASLVEAPPRPRWPGDPWARRP